MKTYLSIAVLLLTGISFCNAQTGNNQLSVGAEVNFLLSNGYSSIYNPGFGGNLKGMYGIGKAGQLTLASGYVSYSGKSGSEFGDQRLSLIPILAGYRYNLKSGFYAEGQAGLGILGTNFSGGSFSQTDPAVAANAGYTYKGLDLSLRFYSEGDVISILAIRVAYNISFGSKHN